MRLRFLILPAAALALSTSWSRLASADEAPVVVLLPPLAGVVPPPPAAPPMVTELAPQPAELPPPTPPAMASAYRTEWYGWQTLLTDTLAVGLMGTAFVVPGSNAGALGGASFGTYALGAPIVHAAHGRWGIAGADLGMRVGTVFVGTLVGAGLGALATSRTPPCGAVSASQVGCTGGDGFGELGGAAVGAVAGFVVGAATASILDATLLAHQKVRVADDSPSTAFTWTPTVAPRRDGAMAGVTGTF